MVLTLCIVNFSVYTYNPTNLNTSPVGVSFHFAFTGIAPRKGWRTPLDKNRYSEYCDEETGYGYFGARHKDHELTTMWLSVDPMSDKYPSISPYAYCAWNPMKLVDPDGQFPIIPDSKKLIANAITASAEFAYGLYLRSATIVQANPIMLSKVNNSISSIKKGIEKVTDMNPRTMGWGDLTNIWLYELGNSSKISFGLNDRTTKELSRQQGVTNARNEAINNIKKGIFDDVSKSWQYGQDQFYEGIKEGNVVTSFLGSYNTSVRISPGSNEGEYTLNFEVGNTSSWESATRLRKDHDGNGNHDAIIQSKARGSGIRLGGNFSQTWRWSETINIQ